MPFTPKVWKSETNPLGPPADSGTATPVSGPALEDLEMRLGNYIAVTVPTISVKDPAYGAIGNGTTDDTVAIQAAINAAASNGGIVVFPPGTYKVTAEITLPDRVHLRGAGKSVSTLWYPTDLGSGKIGIKPTTTAASSDLVAHSITALSILGPGVRTIGVRTCNMDGVALASQGNMTDVSVQSFGAGIQFWGDHNRLYNVKSANNYYNVLWPDGGFNRGNQCFYSCRLEGSLFASLAIAGSNIMDNCLLVNCDIGFGPYGVYKFDGLAPATSGMLSQTTFQNTSFEYIGNAAILDESTGAPGPARDSIGKCTFDNAGFSWSDPSYKIAARDRNYAVNIQNCQDWKLRQGAYPFLAGDLAAFKIAANRGSNVFDGVVTNMFDANSDANFRVSQEDARGSIKTAHGTISQGDLLAYVGDFFGVERFGTGNNTGVFAGVAMTDAVNGQRVPVATDGELYVTCESVAQGGEAIAPYATTRYHGATVPNYGQAASGLPNSDPIIGWSIGPGGAPGGGGCPVSLRGPIYDRNYVRPTVALAYSATIATNVAVSSRYTVNATNGTAFTISAPTNAASGKEITYDIKNSSGGAMGAITWDATFLLAGAFINPANTKRRTITFYYDGSNWIELTRAGADI